MPDPTAHAADMTSPAIIKPDEMPTFWWLNPWGYALNLKRALHAVHILSETTEAAHQAAKTVIKQKEQLAELHKTERYDFLRQVEVTLENAGGPKGYADTIDLVHWAVDEIKRLKAGLSVMTEDRDAYVNRLKAAKAECQKAGDDIEKMANNTYALEVEVKTLQDKVNDLEAKWPRDLWHGGKIYGDVYTCQPHSKTHNETKAGLNPAKLAKENQSLRERLADAKQGIKNIRLDEKRTRKGLLMEQRENMRLRASLNKATIKKGGSK